MIASPSLTGFTVIPGDGSDPFDCSIVAGPFDCPDRNSTVEDLRPGVDAVFTAQVAATGAFSSARLGSGEQDATITCEGTACAALGNWPCSMHVEFEIAAE